MQKLFQYLIILLFGLYVLILQYSGDLALYIHPRYFLLNAGGGMVCVIVGILGLIHTYRRRTDLHQDLQLWQPAHLLVVITLLLAFGLPSAQLSVRAASQRIGGQIGFAEETNSTVQAFVEDSSQYDIAEWVRIVTQQADQTKLIGKEVSVTGFVFQPEGFGGTEFLVSRFVVRCCVVDASPVGLPVVYDWQSEFELQSWVEIKGHLQRVQIAGQTAIAIIPTQITQIAEPEVPYIY